MFHEFGRIESLRILPDKECAFVNFMTTEEAVRAKSKMEGAAVGNMIIKIGFGKADPIGGELSDLGATRSLWIGNIGRLNC